MGPPGRLPGRSPGRHQSLHRLRRTRPHGVPNPCRSVLAHSPARDAIAPHVLTGHRQCLHLTRQRPESKNGEKGHRCPLLVRPGCVHPAAGRGVTPGLLYGWSALVSSAGVWLSAIPQRGYLAAWIAWFQVVQSVAESQWAAHTCEVLPQRGHNLRRQLSREGAATGSMSALMAPAPAPSESPALQEKSTTAAGAVPLGAQMGSSAFFSWSHAGSTATTGAWRSPTDSVLAASTSTCAA
jgi:hypothetical protein